jgi:uncharacterized membrane protein YqgA involved in biofilm formation
MNAIRKGNVNKVAKIWANIIGWIGCAVGAIIGGIVGKPISSGFWHDIVAISAGLVCLYAILFIFKSKPINFTLKWILIGAVSGRFIGAIINHTCKTLHWINTNVPEPIVIGFPITLAILLLIFGKTVSSATDKKRDDTNSKSYNNVSISPMLKKKQQRWVKKLGSGLEE